MMWVDAAPRAGQYQRPPLRDSQDLGLNPTKG